MESCGCSAYPARRHRDYRRSAGPARDPRDRNSHADTGNAAATENRAIAPRNARLCRGSRTNPGQFRPPRGPIAAQIPLRQSGRSAALARHRVSGLRCPKAGQTRDRRGIIFASPCLNSDDCPHRLGVSRRRLGHFRDRGNARSGQTAQGSAVSARGGGLCIGQRVRPPSPAGSGARRPRDGSGRCPAQRSPFPEPGARPPPEGRTGMRASGCGPETALAVPGRQRRTGPGLAVAGRRPDARRCDAR